MSLVPTSQTPHALRYEIAPPRLPEVERDARTGGILDAHGKPVRSARNPAAVPILGPDGQPATARNPAMDALPELGPAELAELAMRGRAWRRETKVARARRIKRDARKGRQALDGMAKAGDIGLEKRRSGWRILPPGDIVDRFRR